MFLKLKLMAGAVLAAFAAGALWVFRINKNKKAKDYVKTREKLDEVKASPTADAARKRLRERKP